MSYRLALKNPAEEKRLYAHRMAVAGLGVLLLFAVLVYRYIDLQVLQHESYRTQSDRNRVQLQPVPPRRGLIYDRNGVLLAENVPSHSLTLILERVEDVDATLALLDQIIGLDADEVDKFRERARRRRPYEAVPLKFRLSEAEIAEIAVNRYRLPGVEVGAELVRHYPHGPLFAHALGYVGRISEREQRVIDEVDYSGTHHIGKIGLEKYYEDVLHGSVGYQNVETNARGRVLRVLERTDPVPGQDLVLHLDAGLQRVAFEALGDERGAVVAIDPATGGVLAIASTPSYDANLFVNGISSSDYTRLRESPDLPLFDRSLQGQYPPGSTVKPIFGLAGLHYGVVTPADTVRDPGWYQLPNDERFYRDWKKGGHAPRVDLHQAIVESCDVYFYDLAYELGIDRLHEFSSQFGLGQLTGIDNTHERPGLMPSREWKRSTRGVHWFPGETLNVGIGQGYMLVTPLQLAVSTAALANRGHYRPPALVRGLGDQPQPPVPGHTIAVSDPDYWPVIIKAMEDVVHGLRGTAQGIRRGAGYRMAGKTGTAQVIGIAQDEEYDAELIAKRQRDHALFVGFAPVDAPRIVVAVVVENGEHGSTTAAPIARDLFDYWLEQRPQDAQLAAGDMPDVP